MDNSIKNLMDFLVGFILVIVLAPVFLLVILILFLTGIKPVFSQNRLGKNCISFRIYKFRTMNEDRDQLGNLLPDKDRLTSFGKLLRKSSIDELPQLINVLKGDMSIVGPRPLLSRYKDRYNVKQIRRHEVKPGITGLAQISGRNMITWEKKFELDVWYVDNRSISLDIRIIFKTILKVFNRNGVNSTSDVTMPEFLGSSNDKE